MPDHFIIIISNLLASFISLHLGYDLYILILLNPSFLLMSFLRAAILCGRYPFLSLLPFVATCTLIEKLIVICCAGLIVNKSMSTYFSDYFS